MSERSHAKSPRNQHANGGGRFAATCEMASAISHGDSPNIGPILAIDLGWT